LNNTPEKEPDHVFEDRSGIRGRVVVLILVVLTVASLVWLWDFGRRLLIDAPVAPVSVQAAGGARPLDALITLQSNAAMPCARDGSSVWRRQRLVLGYLPAADSTALTGMRSRCDQLDRVLADAFLLGAPDGTVVPLWAGRNRALQALAVSNGLPGGSALPIARITASTRTDELATLLSPGPELDRLVADMTMLLASERQASLCINLEAHPTLAPEVLRHVLTRLKSATEGRGRRPAALCLIAGPEAGFWRDPDLVTLLDLAVVKGFREAASPLIAPAPPDWFEAAMTELRIAIPGPKLVVALGSFGERWQSGQSRGTRISYAETHTLAEEFGASPQFDPAAGATRLQFLDASRQVNSLWLLDAATVFNQLAALSWDQSVVIWPLGYEDPAIWSLLQPDRQARPPHLLLQEPINLSSQVLTKAGGPALAAIQPAVEGQRWLRMDASGARIEAQGHDRLPLPHRVQLQGGGVAGGIMLAFDGLPSSVDVDHFITTLATTGAKAAFFVDLPALLQRGAAAQKLSMAGHVLGLRVLPPLPNRPESQLAGRMQMNAVQLYLTRHFGKPARLVLLRPGAGPPHYSSDAFAAETDLLGRGLISVRSSFDAPFGPIDPTSFVDRILREGDPGQTQVITLDLRESGPDLALALPGFLARLAADGFQFVALDEATLSGSAAPASITLPVSQIGDGFAFGLLAFFLNGVTVLFFVMLVISAIFSVIYITLSLLRRPNGAIDPDFTPPVSVVIPAFNEEKVIAACLASVLRSDYPNFQVYIVDDGSTDHTSDVIRSMVAEHPRVHLLQEENAGKWHAANYALSQITTPIFIAADADSIFLPDTIRWLVQPFKDEKVGAVAGLVEVGNRVNILSDFQHQEYMVTQNVLRRAHEFFDGILVVPGAVGAWRTRAVQLGGGFSGETITEDADLTVAVHRAGYRVRFEERARSITEAPVTVRAFMRQRLRWQLGMLQVSWKHRRVITSGLPIGFSVVDSIWFGPVSLLLAILDDILLVTVVGTALYSIVLREALPGGVLPILLFTSYFIMTGIEVLRTLTAFWFERRFEWKTLLLIPLLRFGYRQLLYLTAIRGLFRALTGHPTGWYKIDRTGTKLRAADGRQAGSSAVPASPDT
jgi:peptidoglycan-N-acetylglucosamine deacetylase